MIIAVDAMGGDGGPSVVLHGCSLFLKTHPSRDLRFHFYGDAAQVETMLRQDDALAGVSVVHHSDRIITSDTPPASAIRHGRQSQLAMALQSVVDGKAHAVVSAGNTGAYMALAKTIFQTLNDLDRPALPGWIPTPRGETLLLDVGANIVCSAHRLVQFAMMGEVLVREQFGVANPLIGVLNVGSEDIKGNSLTQEVLQTLRQIEGANIHGFVEGDDITAGTTDVVVTDGFTGNVAIKAMEGTARLMSHFLRESFTRTAWHKLMGLLATPSLKEMKKRSDPRLYNGSVFLGLKHVAVKSHGGADAVGFANALGVASRAFEHNLITKMEERLSLVP